MVFGRRVLLGFLLGLLAAPGCIGSKTEQCSWGEVCPSNRYCNEEFGLCLFPGQVEVCQDASELEVCTFPGVPPGTYGCSGGLCLPTSCGDGFVGPGEMCDDNNQVGGDGCSASCRSDERCGNGVVDVLLGESCDDGNLGSHDGCSSGCRSEAAVWRNGGGVVGARYGIFGAYYANQQRVVFFGGVNGAFQPTDQTWEHDGVAWIRRTLATQPSSRMDHSLTQDAGRQRLVLFAGWTGNAALADTWEYDGLDWTQIITPTAPALRSAHGAAFDAQRGRVVIFGGEDAARSCFDDTWEYDGINWARVTTAVTPHRRRYPFLAYDKVRQVTVMFGGSYDPNSWLFLSDTWEYDGTDWELISTAQSPSARHGHRMVWDSVRSTILLYGGIGENGEALSDLWEYDGSSWLLLASTTPPVGRLQFLLAHDSDQGHTLLMGGITRDAEIQSDTWRLTGDTWSEATVRAPTPRAGHVMAYDGGRDQIVLFGGYDDYTYNPISYQLRSDTWVYADRSWAPLATVQQPVARSYSAMITDPALDALILFGGASGVDAASLLSDTWLFDGPAQAWLRLTLPTSPSPRKGHAMAFDELLDQVILFGGNNGLASLDDTWRFDGYDWSEIGPLAVHPTPRRGHAMAYDASLERIVLFGGVLGYTSYADTWTFDGQHWRQEAPLISPPARNRAMLVYHAARGRVVLYGGEGSLGGFNDTWEYDGTTWLQLTFPSEEIRPLSRSAAAYVPVERAMVLFGGLDGTNTLGGETWRYRFESEWPDEDCADGVDDDDDGLIDCDDPDCFGHPCGAGHTCVNTDSGPNVGVCQ